MKWGNRLSQRGAKTRKKQAALLADDYINCHQLNYTCNITVLTKKMGGKQNKSRIPQLKEDNFPRLWYTSITMGRNISNQRLKCITHFSKLPYSISIIFVLDPKAKTDCTVLANNVSCRSVILYNHFRKNCHLPKWSKEVYGDGSKISTLWYLSNMRTAIYWSRTHQS